MKAFSKVSIVLPTFNGEKYIRKAIDSCLSQNHKNIELIVVDDGSTDKTSKIANSFKDKRIKYLRHKKNKGLPFALNTGFRKATGDWLTWTSDDNFYAREAIGQMLSFLRKKKYLFVYCDYYQFKNDNISNKKIVRLPEIRLLEEGNIIGPCFLYSRKLMEKIGDYHPETALAEDYDYWIRASKKFTISHLKKPLYFYRYHSSSLTRRRLEESKVVNFLVRFRNDLLDIDQACDLFINLIAGKRRKFFRLNKLLAKIFFSREIKSILEDYKKGKISFRKVKLNLTKVVGL